MSRRIELVRRGPDGNPTWTLDGLSLIIDVPVEDIQEAIPDGATDIESLPWEWLATGFRRVEEAKAANENNDFAAALLHIALQQGDDVDMDNDGTLWLVTNAVEP